MEISRKTRTFAHLLLAKFRTTNTMHQSPYNVFDLICKPNEPSEVIRGDDLVCSSIGCEASNIILRGLANSANGTRGATLARPSPHACWMPVRIGTLIPRTETMERASRNPYGMNPIHASSRFAIRCNTLIVVQFANLLHFC